MRRPIVLASFVLGLSALRAVNSSDGRLRGRRLALAGLLLGGVGTAVTLAGGLAMVALRLRALGREHRLDRVRHHPDLVGRDGEQLRELALRELRHRDHAPCRAPCP